MISENVLNGPFKESAYLEYVQNAAVLSEKLEVLRASLNDHKHLNIKTLDEAKKVLKLLNIYCAYQLNNTSYEKVGIAVLKHVNRLLDDADHAEMLAAASQALNEFNEALTPQPDWLDRALGIAELVAGATLLILSIAMTMLVIELAMVSVPVALGVLMIDIVTTSLSIDFLRRVPSDFYDINEERDALHDALVSYDKSFFAQSSTLSESEETLVSTKEFT